MADSPLTDCFTARNLSLMDFGNGARVPLWFSDPAAEHLAVRRAAGLFDFSFMACLEFSGPIAAACLQRLQTRNLSALGPGRIAYTLLLREDGSVLNDATVWRHGPDRWWLFTGRRTDRAHVEAVAAHSRAGVGDCSQRFAVLALQGPLSARVLRTCITLQEPPGPAYYGFTHAQFHGAGCWIGRIGYTGELGFELVVEAGAGPELWDALRVAGAPFGLAECGFEAADSLRIEAGHILFTRELRFPVTPRELMLTRLLAGPGAGYIGAEALRGRRREIAPRRLVGLLPQTRSHHGAPRSAVGCECLLEDFRRIAPGTGCLTSAGYSPVFDRVLGLGFVAEEDRYPGTRVTLTSGDTAEVARLPFHDPGKVLPRGGGNE